MEFGHFLEDQERLERDGFYLNTGFVDVRVFSLFPDSSFYLGRRVQEYIDHYMLDRRLPGGCRIISKPSDREPRINLWLKKENQPYVAVHTPVDYQIAGPDEELFIPRLPYLAYTLGERIRQEELDLFSLHAAALSIPDDNGSILILGDKGSGKTSLALALGREGYKLIGNDLVLVKFYREENQAFIPAGTQIFDVRRAVIEHFFPQLVDCVADNSLYSQDHPYESKMVFYPEDIGIVPGGDQTGLRLIVRINIHPNNTETIVIPPPNRIIEALRLNENLGRYIRGVTTPVVLGEKGIEGYLPCLDGQEINEKRNALINFFLNRVPFFYISARSPNEAAFEVNHLITGL